MMLPAPAAIGLRAGPAPRVPWPGPPRGLDPALARVAEQFEVMIAERLLNAARAAPLGDDLLGSGGSIVRDQIDHARAEAIARAAPIGIARLLAAGQGGNPG
jgi:hypothetical protein